MKLHSGERKRSLQTKTKTESETALRWWVRKKNKIQFLQNKVHKVWWCFHKRGHLTSHYEPSHRVKMSASVMPSEIFMARGNDFQPCLWRQKPGYFRLKHEWFLTSKPDQNMSAAVSQRCRRTL